MSDGLETCRKISAIIGALLALGIAIPFTVVYAHQYHDLRATQTQCTASQTFNNITNSVDVTEKFLLVMRFGFIFYLLCTIFILFSFLAAIHPVVGGINALFQSCCVSPVGSALIITVGVFRYSWYGSACSYPGAPLAAQG